MYHQKWKHHWWHKTLREFLTNFISSMVLSQSQPLLMSIHVDFKGSDPWWPRFWRHRSQIWLIVHINPQDFIELDSFYTSKSKNSYGYLSNPTKHGRIYQKRCLLCIFIWRWSQQIYPITFYRIKMAYKCHFLNNLMLEFLKT